MNYKLEDIYLLVGREDKVAGITFIENSDAYNMYGKNVTVVFLYTERERFDLDNKILKKTYSSEGNLKIRYLIGRQTEEQIIRMESEGFSSKDISYIIHYVGENPNTYHSREKRFVKEIGIPMKIESNGGDLDWMYGFIKKMVEENVGLTPYDRRFYLAAKYLIEPNRLSKLEMQELNVKDKTIREDIELMYLNFKYKKGDLDAAEIKRCTKLFLRKKEQSKKILDRYLIEAGSSLKKLKEENKDQAAKLFDIVMHYKDKNLNTNSKVPVYLDIDSYLHIYMRHVEEIQINKHFEHKDNFQWNERDVLFVMKEVVMQVNEEIQCFFIKHPDKRYSRYGDKNIYFQGDYYTVHIEPTGRVSTFYKNRKKLKD